MTDDDDLPGDEERAEAQRLAEALERAADQRAPDPAVADALDAADLIAASRLPELAPARAEAVLRTLHDRIDAQRARRRNRRIALAAVTSTLAAAAAVLLILARPGDVAHESAPAKTALSEAAPAAPDATALREVDSRAATVAAQRAWLDDPSAANRDVLSSQLAAYREMHLAELERRLMP